MDEKGICCKRKRRKKSAYSRKMIGFHDSLVDLAC